MSHYMIKFISDLRQVGGFLHQSNWQPRYIWHIVESGFKYHNHNINPHTSITITDSDYTL